MKEGSGREALGAAWFCLFIVGFNLAYVSAQTGLLHKPKRVLETDHYSYIEMAKAMPGKAEDPRAREAPFCFRVLVPFFVFLLTKAGVGIHSAFFLSTNAFLFGYLCVFYLYLRRLGVSYSDALLGLTLIGLMQGAVRWYEYQYWMPDPLCLLLVTLAFERMESGDERTLRIVSVLGVAARETFLVVIPYYFLRLLKREGLSVAARKTLLLVCGPAAIMVLLHAWISPLAEYNFLATAKEMLGFRARHFWENQAYFVTIGTFGVLVPVLLLFPGRIPRALATHFDKAMFVALVYFSLAFANNTDRLLVYALPVLLPAGLGTLEEFTSRVALPRSAILAVVVALQALFFVETRFSGELGISIYQPTNLAVVSSLITFWLLCQALLWRQRSRTPT